MIRSVFFLNILTKQASWNWKEEQIMRIETTHIFVRREFFKVICAESAEYKCAAVLYRVGLY